MESIRRWFQDGRPYNAGVQLYLRHGDDDLLKTILVREGQSPFKEVKLCEALRQLVKPALIPSPTPERSHTKPAYHHWPPPPIANPFIKALWDQWRPKYGEMKSLQQRLYHVALGGQTDRNKLQDACQMTHRILTLDDEIDGIYRQRDEYLQSGKLPAAVEAIEETFDPVRWAIELKNNERYVRDYKAKLAKSPTNKKAIKWAATLLKKQALVAKFKKLLKIE